MSLVAYGSSSDEESDNEDETQQHTTFEIPTTSNFQTESLNPSTNGHISDDDDEFIPTEKALPAVPPSKPRALALPKPKNIVTSQEPDDDLNEILTPLFTKLPMPKGALSSEAVIEEEDDEFLRKKELPDVEIKKPPPPPSSNPVQRAPVKITIPSMKEFSDVDAELAKSNKNKSQDVHNANLKKSGLLAMLPKAKSERNFAKGDSLPLPANPTNIASNSRFVASCSLIPDTVKNRRPAQNTEGVDGIRVSSLSKKSMSNKKIAQPKMSLVECSESETSDNEAGDFFSLNDDEKLPEINKNEISVMVAKKAAKMAEATTKYLEANTLGSSSATMESEEQDEEELRKAQKRYNESQLNEEALQALVGSSSKRRRQNQSEIDIVDISSSQVLPDRDEWMRTALASSTSYQPTGVLVDEEPAAGTRRKHQITYLAHKAKANEAELQAMWSANRQNRRATQSKYGF